ncbi:TIGR02444 family protein [Bradyrhizobium sp.]|uniref:TIGR02444 family protein n=1 Tax=Bradyrhizobium sp. TaxID=376 RepID=UPI00261BBD4B|nr:TIGR02444 family protein [Bradyrhizobium sp.]
MRSAPEIAAESWAFALAIYVRPGVAEACLTLQSELGVDVMLLLMSAFAAVKHRIPLTADEINALDASCRPWREQIMRKLRAIRTELKTGPAPAPGSATEPFRSQVKALELEAEKIENRLLAECLPLRQAQQEVVRPDQLRGVLTDVAMHFARQRGTKLNASLSSSIEVILEAAMQDAS